MPTARSRTTSSVAGGKIYLIGGSDSDTSWFSRAIEVYDPATDTWARKKPTPFNLDMTPENLTRGSAVTVDGKIHTMGWDGGGSNFMSMDIAMVYDPQAETWTDLTSMPQGPRSLNAACAAGGKIHAGGGYASGTILPYVEEYDPALDP